ncbi:MAG TPA: hypothetical protein PLR32_02010 [candidate division Zixibacteria bacterium]|nr:hypothetical protein [candidate division Zixibacteria bacterium]
MKRENRLAELRDLAAQTARLRLEVVEQLGPLLLDLAARVAGVIGAGGKLLIAGNGLA